MANAMKCDRCGKLYESYNTKKDNKNINGFIWMEKKSLRSHIQMFQSLR